MPIYNLVDARDLTPEDKLSPIDIEGIDFDGVLNIILETEEIRESIGEEYLDTYKEAVLEDIRLGRKQSLDLIRWYNNINPNNPISIPSETNTIAGWLARPTVQTQWDIEQLMAQGTTLIISGVTGIGKTWETNHLAFQFRTGGIWHGLQCRQLMPICVNLELTENQMQARVVKLAQLYPTVTDINFLARKGGNYRLNTLEGKENLLELLRSYGLNYGVVILDPLALFIDGKLEKLDWNGEVEPVLTQIKQEFGCSIVLNHNFRKKIQIYGHSEDMFAADRLKGVADIIDRVDNIVLFVSESQPRRNEGGESRRIEIAKWIHAAKTRDADRELKPHRVTWDYDGAMFVPEDGIGWSIPIDDN